MKTSRDRRTTERDRAENLVVIVDADGKPVARVVAAGLTREEAEARAGLMCHAPALQDACAAVLAAFGGRAADEQGRVALGLARSALSLVARHEKVGE